MTPLRALVVDDEEDMRVVATVFLEMDGQFEVISVASGREAVAAAAQAAPDVILLDYMMPEMNGPDTMAALRAQPATADVPIIFLTARSDEGTLADLSVLGAHGVVPKPFNPDTLSVDILKILKGTR